MLCPPITTTSPLGRTTALENARSYVIGVSCVTFGALPTPALMSIR
jgi:hypothetical protein